MSPSKYEAKHKSSRLEGTSKSKTSAENNPYFNGIYMSSSKYEAKERSSS